MDTELEVDLKNKDQIIFTVGDLGISLNKENLQLFLKRKNIIGQVLSINEKGESSLISRGIEIRRVWKY